jgi:glyoxylase-like metal-dependent hydrolase (beta-lactamase superfamily II)
VAADEVLPGIHRISIRMGYVNAYLVDGSGELTLVDTGLFGVEKTILRAIHNAGRTPADLRHIAITHHHTDHAGSLAKLMQKTPGARVYAHPLDVPVITGASPVPGPNPASRAGKMLGPLLMRLQPGRLGHVDVQVQVQDGQEIPAAGGMTVVHTPGHTAGHVSYLKPGNGGVLFVGDAAGNLFGKVGPPIGMFTEDMAQARESIRKIAALEFDAAVFGHGGVAKGKAGAAFRRWVERNAK